MSQSSWSPQVHIARSSVQELNVFCVSPRLVLRQEIKTCKAGLPLAFERSPFSFCNCRFGTGLQGLLSVNPDRSVCIICCFIILAHSRVWPSKWKHLSFQVGSHWLLIFFPTFHRGQSLVLVLWIRWLPRSFSASEARCELHQCLYLAWCWECVLQSRAQQTVSVKGQIGSLLGLAGRKVSVPTTQLRCCSMKAAVDTTWWVDYGYVPVKLMDWNLNWGKFSCSAK